MESVYNTAGLITKLIRNASFVDQSEQCWSALWTQAVLYSSNPNIADSIMLIKWLLDLDLYQENRPWMLIAKSQTVLVTYAVYCNIEWRKRNMV